MARRLRHRHLRRDLRAAGDQQARQVRGETLGERIAARGGIEALEKAHLAFAEQQDAAGLQVFMESREREAGLLNVRTCNLAMESAGAGQQLDGQPHRLGSRIEQPANGDGRSHRTIIPPRRRRGKLEQNFSLVRRRNLQLFAVLRNRAPGQHQAFPLQDVDDLGVAERLSDPRR